MKAKASKKAGTQLRHSPLGNVIEKSEKEERLGKLKVSKSQAKDDFDEDLEDEEDVLPSKIASKIARQADEQRMEMQRDSSRNHNSRNNNDDSDAEDEDAEFEDEEDVELDGEYVDGVDLSQAEEAVVQKFLMAGRNETRSLADIIMEKLKEREEGAEEVQIQEESQGDMINIPPKVIEVYTAVGKLLAHYKSGKLPKALKMLPHLKNWEHILWLTRPDEWSPAATYAATRIFASNLNPKMAQRFMNLVLLEKCRDDIRVNNKLNYHLYLALKKSLFKPAAFYKGILLPLAQSGSCTLREATIFGSVLSKVSIPGNHSAAVLLRLAEMPYTGSTSSFIKTLLNKKYALPRRVIEALVCHFCNFAEETRTLPVSDIRSVLLLVLMLFCLFIIGYLAPIVPCLCPALQVGVE